MTDSKDGKFKLTRLGDGTSNEPASGNEFFNLGRNSDFANTIYSKIDTENPHAISQLVDKNVEIFLFDRTEGDTQKAIDGNLKSVVLIDKTNKSVVVVTAGTRIDGEFGDMIADVRDDLLLSFGFQPQKKQEVQSLNDLIIQEIPDDGLKDYKFHYTGHSLGAVMSDIAATNMAMKLLKQDIPVSGKISTITFDNPGSYTLVNKMLKNYKKKSIEEENSLYTNENNQNNKDLHNKKLEDINNLELKDFVDYKSFNNRPNAINTTDKQAGKVYTIVPKEQKERNLFLRMIGYLAEKIPGKFIKKILSLISFGSPTEQIKEHGVDNFIEVLKKENGTILYHDKSGKTDVTILDIMHNTKPLELNHKEIIFDTLEKIHKESDNKSVEFSISIPIKSPIAEDSIHHTSKKPNVKLVKRIEFSRKDLATLLAQEDISIPKDVQKDLVSHLRYDQGSYKPRDPVSIRQGKSKSKSKSK